MTTTDRIRELWPQTATTGSVVEIPNVGREDLARLFAELGFRRGVEVGTERGLYAETLCKYQPDPFVRFDLTCVDPYEVYSGYREHTSQLKLDRFYAEARERLAKYGVHFMRQHSIDASRCFADSTLDFVYIDGNHSLLHVIQDLCYWVPKVRSGGIVSGHDYIRRAHTGYAMHVVQAVHAYADSYGIDPYYVLGSKAIVEGEVRDQPRSWFFVKQ